LDIETLASTVKVSGDPEAKDEVKDESTAYSGHKE
jgi:hypothetical protein